MSKRIKATLISVPKDAETPTLFSKKIRPNGPCPCGSGKKAKKCCGTERQYSYLRHVNYIRREETLSEAELNKTRDGKTTSRFCFEVGHQVVISEQHPDESIGNKSAVVKVRGLCHDYLKPYYLISIENNEQVYGKWVAEEHLQHLIV